MGMSDDRRSVADIVSAERAAQLGLYEALLTRDAEGVLPVLEREAGDRRLQECVHVHRRVGGLLAEGGVFQGGSRRNGALVGSGGRREGEKNGDQHDRYRCAIGQPSLFHHCTPSSARVREILGIHRRFRRCWRVMCAIRTSAIATMILCRQCESCRNHGERTSMKALAQRLVRDRSDSVVAGQQDM